MSNNEGHAGARSADDIAEDVQGTIESQTGAPSDTLSGVVRDLARNVTDALRIVVGQGKAIQETAEKLAANAAEAQRIEGRLQGFMDTTCKTVEALGDAVKAVSESGAALSAIVNNARDAAHERIDVVEERGEQAAERLSRRLGEARDDRREIRNDVQDVERRVNNLESDVSRLG